MSAIHRQLSVQEVQPSVTPASHGNNQPNADMSSDDNANEGHTQEEDDGDAEEVQFYDLALEDVLH